ncbi:winged helix-turn-helix transcriptional regulator [Pantoea eucalypti]|jgi:DNA-binding HxlR family transcriptional regulator|uniref:Helix-turn-helix transcriptional regulator n=1 Tax=Pantoea eucalypti TaxID=470933 RepID=A0ABY2ZEH2_9GAMM|nr:MULTISPECIES: helix-turn-helix domain-containing protein [Pantoea]PQL27284.1 transcriptional regulator [Pantoea ananatis]QXG55219.1 helix-turn-helix transcriptional regulator [Pantoea jilinensis]AWP31708.1 transcriptional regulator [Pantoea vagans]EFM19948.1 transcriptional regulator, HxlR family [Pantoea sp. aB]ELP25849.1 Redox-sensing transcriptional regulator QorR [Pantoea agglomerans 299R]
MSDKLSEKFSRGELLNVNCPSRDVLKRVTSRWSVLILLALQDQTLRFSELRRTVGGVSERMLAQNLRYLEEDGFVQRIAYDVVPPHVEYRLTPLGREVGEQVVGLADWLELNLGRILAQREKSAAE